MTESEDKQRARRDLTSGSIRRHLLVLSIPMSIGILANALFNLVDAYLVSKLGADELAALSFTFPVTLVVFNCAIGLGIGASSTIAREAGAQDRQGLKDLTTTVMLLAVVLGVMMQIIGLSTIDLLFPLLGTPPHLLPLVRSFMVPWYWGVPFVLIPIMGVNVLRALGDTVMPALVMVLGALVNLILDPLLIFGFHDYLGYGLAGAAYASVFSRVAGFLLCLFLIIRREQLIGIAHLKVATVRQAAKRILAVSFPAILTNMIVPVTGGIIVALLSSFGPEAVAGFGVASRIETFALLAFLALSATIGPVIGQNYGAKKHDRVRETLETSARFCILGGAIIALILVITASFIAKIFVEDSHIQSIVIQYLTLVPISYGALGVIYSCNAAFNGLGMAFRATGVSLLRMVLLTLPAAALGKLVLGIDGILLGSCLGNFGAAYLAYRMSRKALAHDSLSVWFERPKYTVH